MQTICVLGRQPALGLAELESRFGSSKIERAAADIALIRGTRPDHFNDFGGILKAAELLDTFNYTDWSRISRQLPRVTQILLEQAPAGKITLGVSVYDLQVKRHELEAASLSLKKTIKKTERSARIVPNKEPALNTAQVLHNKLDRDNGIELLLIRSGQNTLVARTFWVQDIEAYRRRDQERPMRDSRVGMLPPKLAQTIVNLAVGAENMTASILDPFCGTGVILQESILMGYGVIGSDLDARMVDYSRKNIDWLKTNYIRQDFAEPEIYEADATSHEWTSNFDTIAAETYLGRALSSVPDPDTLQKIVHDGNSIHKKFLKNVACQTSSGFRMCIAVPAWHTNRGVIRLPLLDQLEDLGYNRASFVHANTEDLVYHRENQIVGRELVVLIRK